MKTIKLCENCGEPVGPGRSDRKYCSDACKSEYNNNKDKSAEAEPPVAKYIKLVQDALVENRRILDDFLGDRDTATIDKLDLDGRGFRFKYFTSRTPAKSNGNIYCFCFELGYWVREDDTVLVVRRTRENYLLK